MIMVCTDTTVSSRSTACSLRFVGLVSKLDGPYPELIDYFRFDCSLQSNATTPGLLAPIIRITHSPLPKAITRRAKGTFIISP